MRNQAHSLSVVFPTFNEEANLESVITNGISVLQNLVLDFEVIIVDDGSTDLTPLICASLRSIYPQVKSVRHESNRGYGAALKSGFDLAAKDLIFFTDSDGQFSLDELGLFLASIQDREMVIGFRKKRMDSWHRKINSRTGNLLARICLGIRARDINCAYKLFRRNLIQSLFLESDGALINTEILAFAAKKQWRLIELPVKHYPREFGQPTGANAGVIFKTFQEYFTLRNRMRALAGKALIGTKFPIN